MRLLRLAIVTAAATTFVATAAFAGPNCQGSSSASAGKSGCSTSAEVKSASAGGQCASMAAAGQCGTKSAANNAQCAWAEAAKAKGADCQKVCDSAMASLSAMEPFAFLKDVKADQVHTMVQTTDNGIAFVFAAVNDANVAAAKQAAQASVAMMNKPAHCEATRGAMAKSAGSCASTQACLNAMADAEIKVVENERGATAMVVAKDAAKAKELHAFLLSLTATAEPAAKS